MSLKRKGFTLVELLAVIVILAIVLAIAVPIITGIIKKATINAFEQDAKMLIKAIDYQVLQDPGLDINVISASNIESKLGISNNNYEHLSIVLDENNKHYIYIEGKNKWADLVACGTYNNITVESKDNLKVCIGTNGSNVYQDDSNAFVPKLASGMIPIRWDETRQEDSKWVKADENTEWYNYGEKKWANAVLINSDNRSKYINAESGEYIKEADVLAYLVWIPRYRYELFNANKEDVTENPEKPINIEFETSTAVEDKVNGDWLTHPAFIFGDKELEGFWIGKFETACVDDDPDYPLVKPGIASKRGLTVSELFEMNRQFDYSVKSGYSGLDDNFDAHMLKNMEWGAVAYLSHSEYGKTDENGDNIEIDVNKNSSFCTGGGCLSSNDNQYYDNVNQSTTGNVYGVYDMNGGAWEYVMGAMYQLDNSKIYVSSSEFDQTWIDNPDNAKYVDKYDYGTSYSEQPAYDRSQLGDATGETRGWYGDYAKFVYSSASWFQRGGYCGNSGDAGVFAFGRGTGASSSNCGSRLGVS